MIAQELVAPSPVARKTTGARCWLFGCVIVATLGACAVLSPVVSSLLSAVPSLHRAGVTACALIVQALPFVVLGGGASALVAVWMTPEKWEKLIPQTPVKATFVGICLGFLIPSCECASVPLAKRMIGQGLSPAAAVGFMVAAPSLNPFVLLATAIAFNSPLAALSRAIAGLVTVIIVCLCVATTTYPELDRLADSTNHGAQGSRVETWIDAARADIVLATGFLALGGFVAACAQFVLPATIFTGGATNPILGVAIAILGALVLSLCSFGDGFIAASLPFSPLASSTFLAIGPVVDIKLAALMTSVLGERLALRICAGGIIGGVVGAITATAVLGWW